MREYHVRFCERLVVKFRRSTHHNTGLAMWTKRLEKEAFKWPSSTQTSISLTEQQLNSLLGGFNIHGHQPLFYGSAGL